METSAKVDRNINEAFSQLAEAILRKTAGKEASENPDRLLVERRNERSGSSGRACCS